MKTGFTFNAGRCLVTACKQKDLDVIVVVLGADSKKIRTLDSIKVLNYIFSNFKKVDISNIIYEEFYKFENYFSKNVTLEKTTDKAYIDLIKPENTTFPLLKNEMNMITSEIYSLSKISTPTLSGTKVGQISIKINNETLLSSNIIITNNLNKKKPQIYFKEIIENFFNI